MNKRPWYKRLFGWFVAVRRQYSKYLWVFDCLVVGGIVIWLVVSLCLPYPPAPEDYEFKFSLIDSNSCMSVTCAEASAHNLILLNSLSQTSAASMNLQNEREAGRGQARLFYSAIMAVLISVMFIGNRERVRPIGTIALLVILLMYSLDVHMVDMLYRQSGSDAVVGTADSVLVYTPPWDSTWHLLRYDLFRPRYDNLAGLQNRWCRKMRLALQPSLEQSVFYFVPLVLLYCYRAKNRRRLLGGREASSGEKLREKAG